MPRFDRTFSEKDLLRIYNYYLTDSEAEKARTEICDEKFDELENWPEVVCFPLFELLDMVELVIKVATAIWPMVQLSLNLLVKLEELAEMLEWIPVFGELLKRDVDALKNKAEEFDASVIKKLNALQEFFEEVNKYFLWKCYKR